MKAAVIQCSCGERIAARNLVQRSWYPRVFGSCFVYLKYRCPRCKRMGERFIEQENWDENLLRDTPVEVSLHETRRFEQLGKITVDEEVDFHFLLDGEDALKALRDEMEE